jgi:predicted phage gp36 major capsid-like protein
MSKKLNKDLRRPERGAGYDRMKKDVRYESVVADNLRLQQEAMEQASRERKKGDERAARDKVSRPATREAR